MILLKKQIENVYIDEQGWGFLFVSLKSLLEDGLAAQLKLFNTECDFSYIFYCVDFLLFGFWTDL